MKDLKKVLSFPPYPGDYLHPVVYACTAVMLLCLLVSIVTYILHHSVIRINRNGWHTLLNFLFHTGLTFGVFAGGINQINLPFVCQIVGIVLHYASLSTLLWLMFTARNIYKDVSKDPLKDPDRTRMAQTRSKPTILRFYIVSDGVPLIIVGVTAGFGMENYGSRDGALYCWMAWEPSLGAFYAPLTLVVLVMCMYLLCSYIQLKRHPERKYELHVLSEEHQQQLSSYHDCPKESGGTEGDPLSFVPSVSVLANEHSFKSQLRATSFTLLLFLCTWALGALAVTLGHFLDMVFSCLYGAFCVTLGLFLLIQHCAKRDDVWHRWWACCPSMSKAEDGTIPSHRPEVHQPHCQLSSCLAPIMQTTYHKASPLPPSPTPNHTSQCCVAVLTPDAPPPPHTHALPDEPLQTSVPMHSCLTDRTKSRSFNRPRPCLQDYRCHFNSTSMDSPLMPPSLLDLQLPGPSQLVQRQDSVTSCHSYSHNMADSITSCKSLLLPSNGPNSCQWHKFGSADTCCEKPEPYTAPSCSDPYSCSLQTTEKQNHLCVEVEQKGFPRNTLPRQHATMTRRAAIGRNQSLQEDGLFGSDSTGNIRTGPWKNETTV